MQRGDHIPPDRTHEEEREKIDEEMPDIVPGTTGWSAATTATGGRVMGEFDAAFRIVGLVYSILALIVLALVFALGAWIF
jgi:hypothetical protein